MSIHDRRGHHTKTKALINDQVVLDGLIDYREEHDRSPSVRELASYTGIRTATVFTCLKRLEKAGAIEPVNGAHKVLVPLRLEAHL